MVIFILGPQWHSVFQKYTDIFHFWTRLAVKKGCLMKSVEHFELLIAFRLYIEG